MIFKQSAMAKILFLKIRPKFLKIWFHSHKLENFNYLNVAFISYKLTMWDSMLSSDGHKASRPTSKKTRGECPWTGTVSADWVFFIFEGDNERKA